MSVDTRQKRQFAWISVVALAVTSVTLSTQAPEPAMNGAAPSRVVAAWRAAQEGLPYLPGEVLVQFKPGTPVAQVAGALRVLRSQPDADHIHWIGDTMLLTGLDADDPAQASLMLSRQPEVAFAQPNYLRQLHSVPNDPGYLQQWHMEAINMPRAWDINSRAATGVTIAVLDSGLTTGPAATYTFRIWQGVAFGLFNVPFAPASDFDHTHVRPGADFTPTGPWRNSAGQLILFDGVGHGTHVAGTIAQQTNNSNGYAGVAHGATLLPVKVCYGPWDVQLAAGNDLVRGRVRGDEAGCPDASVAAGIRFAVDSGARVINMSLGGPPAAPLTLDALRYAAQRDVFVAIAAGNSALTGNPVNYPAAYAPQLDGVVAVGATGRNGQRAGYSSFGSYLEVAAPGGSLSAPTEDVWQVHPNESDLDVRFVAPAFQRYVGKGMSGTSMAAPHVAGVAALLYSQGITSAAAIEEALKQFARDLGPAGRDNEYGHGLIDARASLRGLGVAR
jgi:serine protease